MKKNATSGGARVCLEFVNTLDRSGSREPREQLATHADLVGWARRAWIVDEAEERALFVEGRLHPETGERVLREAVELREALHRLLRTLTDGGASPGARDLEALSRRVADGAARRRLAATPRGIRWRWVASADDPQRMLWPIGQSAADLVTSDDVRKLRACSECGRLFLDGTKNGSRRFCDKACGDRVKSRRYYRRLRDRAAP